MKPARPKYLRAYNEGKIRELNGEFRTALSNCKLCPQRCGVNRLESKTGICKTGFFAKVSSYAPHFGEEPPLVGSNGSGTIFFTHCNLLCSFCQNYDISHEGYGKTMDDQELAGMMLYLQLAGCHNINFVTPSHVVPQIVRALETAIEQGLKIPLVYNSSGYDNVETLQMLEGIIDIYMPDLKFLDRDTARSVCKADDYSEVAPGAILEMHRQVGNLKMDERGIARSGLLIRHLVMPGETEDAKNIVRFIAENISPDTYLNIMPQYQPYGQLQDTPQFDRRLYVEEYEEVVAFAKDQGMVNLL